MKKIFLLLFLASLGTRLPVFAQGEQSLWYFGNMAGLKFTPGQPPTPLLDSKMVSYENCAVVTNKAGQLLFYTNGGTIYNRQHLPMPNGRKIMGGPEATQGVLIVPDPGSGNVFYVFTTDFQGRPGGMRYSIVDMTRDNGLGDVPRANLLLISPVAEKLAAVRHQNGRDVWVVGHRWNSNAFVAYLVTADGVQTTPILSNVGTMHAGPGRNAIGCMKFSPDGNKLAAAIWRESNKFEVFDFDRTTGLVSKPRQFGPYEEAYGVEFSSDGTKLYGTNNGTGGGAAQIWQFDLKTSKATKIGDSKNRKIGALQRGPDDKIYVAREDNPFLGVIQNPNAAGIGCQYKDDGISLGGKRSKFGLPNFIVQQ